MVAPNFDDRSAEQRAHDDAIAAEPLLPTPQFSAAVKPLPVEAYLAQRRRPLAVAGIVENGVVRPLDASVKLLENSRVIIVASE